MATWLPVLQEERELFSSLQLQIFVGQALFIFAITVPFDIRDMTRDRHNSVVTIPSIIGIWQSKLFALTCLIIFTLVMNSFIKLEYLLMLDIVTGILIAFASANRKEYYFTFFMDATIVLYLGSIILTLKM